MMEVSEESRHVSSHVQRTILFLSAMRHFAAKLDSRGVRVRYIALEDPQNTQSFASEVTRAAKALEAAELACTLPGEWRALEMVRATGSNLKLPVTIWPDEHFLTNPEEFAQWANGRTALTMEYFYREQRRKTGYLMESVGNSPRPLGGEWNFDKENRLPFGKRGPDPRPPAPLWFRPDSITTKVMRTIKALLPDLPGDDASFGWPVTREQALAALEDFIAHRLDRFGPYEDAMWADEPTLYHSTLSCALNLKLLDPRECCEQAIAAFHAGRVPLQSAEAFVRQIIGWREFIRGVYWLEGPGYAGRNALEQHGRLPGFYWTGETDMACMKACIGQVLETGFGHHIQRLMVTGNFALISGIHPRAVSDWYLGMFVDGVDWVTLPNALGMVMHADQRPGAAPANTGLVGTKPYVASGKYIERMSNYCEQCRYRPDERTGPTACPFTVFYWDFLLRYRDRFSHNQRMRMILKNLDRISAPARTQLTIDADLLRTKFGITPAAPEKA